MKTTLSTQLNIATWCVAIILVIINAVNGQPAEALTGNIIATLFWMAVYYLFFLYVVPAFLLKKKLLAFFIISFLIVIILPFVGYSLLFLSKALFKGDFTEFYKGYSIPMHLSGFKAMALAGVYGSFFRLIAEYFGEKRS